MKSLAAVNIRQYEKAVESLEEYRLVIDKGWQVLFRSGGQMPLGSTGGKFLCLVVGSDQGMCGQFNEIIASHAVKKTLEMSVNRENMEFWSSGEKVAGTLLDMGYKEGEYFNSPGSLTAIISQVQAVLERVEHWESQGDADHLYLCHNMISGESGYTQVFYPVLPLDNEWIKNTGDQEWPGHCIPMTGIDSVLLFRNLFRQHLFVSFYRAFAQSLASENAARLMAMQAAEKNVIERGEELQALFREQRQNNITNELLDIISGFEALSDEGY